VGESVSDSKPWTWPLPIHDTLSAYSWILKNLSPSTSVKRDIYVYGSYVGASLATSLSLTESYPHQAMAIRGCIAYNGIYNWTMFLSDHPIHKQPKKGRPLNVLEAILSQETRVETGPMVTDESLWDLEELSQRLFSKPDDMFDPFISPCLFFHTPGLLVPKTFDTPAAATKTTSNSTPPAREPDAVDAIITSMTAVNLDKPSRKSPLKFPPSVSLLQIPEMLLLHTSRNTTPTTAPKKKRSTRKAAATNINDFQSQAEELGGLCRRSLVKVEFKERMAWDDDFGDIVQAAEGRVQISEAGEAETETPYPELPPGGQDAVEKWLNERMARGTRSAPTY
jgi:hypothetical protein